MLFLRTMLGLEPRGNRLTVDADLPSEIEVLEIRGLPGRLGEGRRGGASGFTCASRQHVSVANSANQRYERGVLMTPLQGLSLPLSALLIALPLVLLARCKEQLAGAWSGAQRDGRRDARCGGRRCSVPIDCRRCRSEPGSRPSSSNDDRREDRIPRR